MGRGRCLQSSRASGSRPRPSRSIPPGRPHSPTNSRRAARIRRAGARRPEKHRRGPKTTRKTAMRYRSRSKSPMALIMRLPDARRSRGDSAVAAGLVPVVRWRRRPRGGTIMRRLAFASTRRAIAPHVASCGVVQAASSSQSAAGADEAALSAAHGSSTADPASVVIVGQARFTVLTPQLVRLEWAADGPFEDRPSLVFLNRRLTVPTFTRTSSGGWTTIDTGKLTLRYARAAASSRRRTFRRRLSSRANRSRGGRERRTRETCAGRRGRSMG